ncbi:uncharacterized protein LOC116184592 [Lonchura striata]
MLKEAEQSTRGGGGGGGRERERERGRERETEAETQTQTQTESLREGGRTQQPQPSSSRTGHPADGPDSPGHPSLEDSNLDFPALSSLWKRRAREIMIHRSFTQARDQDRHVFGLKKRSSLQPPALPSCVINSTYKGSVFTASGVSRILSLLMRNG